ncbi:MAG TPA: two-component system response regulator BtsR [Rhodocyclaceae bacterium]|nr:two-component system response regulator BtsR [Rhodocyclaceae bacterium]
MRILIIDDEQLAREELRRMLEREPDADIVGECANAIEGMAAINRLAPEVVFLDIQMPSVSGLEMLSMLDAERMPRVVFLTAHHEYAMQAFEEHAFDYLLKPLDPRRLEVTLQRLRLDRSPNPGLAQMAGPLVQIPCPGFQRVALVKVADVEYVVSKGTGIYVVDREGVERFTELCLRVLEDKTHFLRSHRQFLVNPDCIKEICFQENGSAEIVTGGGRKIPVSRRFLAGLKERLGI